MSAGFTPLDSPKIGHSLFLGFLWTGTGLSLSFLIFRLVVKLRSYREIYSDDYLVIAAWVLLLASTILWQIESPNLYELFDITSGQAPLTSNFVNRDTDLLRSLAPFTLLFYTCLWTVKLSFLVFFRRLGLNVRGQKTWWWCVLAITLLTWAVTVADNDWKCSVRHTEWIWFHCSTPSAIKFVNNTYYGNCTVDVVTDCLIISIPVRMLWNVRLPLGRKLLLMTIFSLTVIVMIVSVIRVTVVNSATRDPDISWLYFWSNIEMSTAVIISCIASFRQVFVNLQNRRRQARPKGDHKLHVLFPWLRLSQWNVRGAGSPFRRKSPKRSREQDLLEEWQTPTHFTPLQSIHVNPSLSVTGSRFRLEDY